MTLIVGPLFNGKRRFAMELLGVFGGFISGVIGWVYEAMFNLIY